MMIVAFYKDANQERKYLGLSITPNKNRMKEYVEKSKREYEQELKEQRRLAREMED